MSRGLPDSRCGAAPYGPGIDTISEHKVFLVERYLPGATVDDARESVRRLTDATVASARVRHLSSTLVPAEGAVFAFFLADSAEAVAAVNHDAGLAVDHLVPAVHLTGLAAHIEGPP